MHASYEIWLSEAVVNTLVIIVPEDKRELMQSCSHQAEQSVVNACQIVNGVTLNPSKPNILSLLRLSVEMKTAGVLKSRKIMHGKQESI